jgi:hypothetical protein
MDIGTKNEPGRELDANAVRDVSGGHIAPTPDEPPPQEDPLGSPGAPPPMDYAVSGGEGCFPPPEPEPEETATEGIIKTIMGTINPDLP